MVRREKCEQEGDLPNKDRVNLASGGESADWCRKKGLLKRGFVAVMAINKPR